MIASLSIKIYPKFKRLEFNIFKLPRNITIYKLLSCESAYKKSTENILQWRFSQTQTDSMPILFKL